MMNRAAVALVRRRPGPWESIARAFGSAPPGFYPVDTADMVAKTHVTGEVVNNSVDLRTMSAGDRVDIPYELTVNASFRDFWHGCFHSNDRINTSTPFARGIGFQDCLLPFSLMLFLTGSMSHADAAKVQVGFKKATYHWPAFPGDTFTRSFVIKSRRSTSDGQNSLFTFACSLKNQRGKVVFTCDKTMLFPFPLEENTNFEYVSPEAAQPHSLRDHLISRAGGAREDDAGTITPTRGSYDDKPESHSLTALRPGQLILHTMCRPLSSTQCMQLSSLARITHERHFDHHTFDKNEIYIPGGLVLGLTNSASSRDLHEVLHEDLLECSYINNLHPGDTVGAMSFVKTLEETVSGDMESLVIRTVALKNINVVEDLRGVPLPMELFNGPVKRPKDYETICQAECPILSNKIAAVLERRILRQAPRIQSFLL